jgi:hypothetical protein
MQGTAAVTAKKRWPTGDRCGWRADRAEDANIGAGEATAVGAGRVSGERARASLLHGRPARELRASCLAPVELDGDVTLEGCQDPTGCGAMLEGRRVGATLRGRWIRLRAVRFDRRRLMDRDGFTCG